MRWNQLPIITHDYETDYLHSLKSVTSTLESLQLQKINELLELLKMIELNRIGFLKFQMITKGHILMIRNVYTNRIDKNSFLFTKNTTNIDFLICYIHLCNDPEIMLW